MKRLLLLILVMPVLLSCGVSVSSPHDTDNKKNLKRLIQYYKDGEVDVCKHQGQTAYSAAINARGAGSVIYDQNGQEIGRCHYALGSMSDAVCKELTDCETVYRVKNNIWGKPPIKKYPK